MFKFKNKLLATVIFFVLFGISGLIANVWPASPFGEFFSRAKVELTAIMAATTEAVTPTE